MNSPEASGDDDVIDAIGEITNLVMGTVKTRFQGSVQRILILVRSVI